MVRQFELVEKIKSYDPRADEDLINRAYVFAMKAHGSQKRASGDPYFTHPLEVANILTSLKLDSASIITGLLHDTLEDTEATAEEIKRLFGQEIAQLVDGVTKLNQLEVKSESIKQAENFRKLVVAMSEDIRVLLVKLADRLHNMRTISHIKKPEKRARIAKETLEIYAPLAERIGMRDVKEELQDLAFAELHSEIRESITNRLSFLRQEGQPLINKIIKHIEETIKATGIKASISGREKTPFSIWVKMQGKNISFEQLSDIMAFRIIVDSVPECYQALGAVHSSYHMIPQRFKDYISTPKPNGYESIHTTVMGPENQRIEIQIRTKEMHEYAELGVAAHWIYKQSSGASKEGKQFKWIRELLEVLEQSTNPEEALENTKLEMYSDQVFCFTPKGDLLSLPRGSTPVDFAFAVHSNVGTTCIGAKVNGRIVPLRTALQNGDQVDIIRSKTGTPSPTWERFVVTAKAKAEIRRFVRIKQRQEYISLGKVILEKTFGEAGHSFNDKILESALAKINRKAIDDVYAEVGEGLLNRNTVLEAIHPQDKTPKKLKKALLLPSFNKKKKAKINSSGKAAIPITGLIPGMAIHYAGCCHPLPGDKIVGIVMTGKGVTIHTTDCEMLDNFSDTPERWVDVAWEKNEIEKTGYIGRIKAMVSHETGSLANVTNAIAKDMGNINNLKILNRTTDYFEMLLDIEVKDSNHLGSIIANLRSVPCVQSVERYRN